MNRRAFLQALSLVVFGVKARPKTRTVTITGIDAYGNRVIDRFPLLPSDPKWTVRADGVSNARFNERQVLEVMRQMYDAGRART